MRLAYDTFPERIQTPELARKLNRTFRVAEGFFRGLERREDAFHFEYDLTLNGKRITGLPSPTADNEAATKNYVDSIASTGVGNLGDIGDVTFTDLAEGDFIQRVGGEWVNVDTAIADGSITQSKMAGGLRVPEILDTLPAPGTTGRLVLLTSDMKIYRDTGGAWTTEVPAVDITGEIIGTQISDDSITTPKIAANQIEGFHIVGETISGDKIAANAITAGLVAAGAIGATHVQTGSLDTTKLSFVPVEDTNVIASINASAEGIRIQADNLHIDATTTFAASYDPSTKETPAGAQSKADDAQSAAEAAAASYTDAELASGIASIGVVIRSGTTPLTRDDGTSLQYGDVWIDFSDENAPYSYNGTNWIRAYTRIDGGFIKTGVIHADRIDTVHLSVIQAAVSELSAITADLGLVTSGHLRNPGNTAAIRLDGVVALPADYFIDFTATGTDYFLSHPSFKLQADGVAVFDGTITAEAFIIAADDAGIDSANPDGDLTKQASTALEETVRLTAFLNGGSTPLQYQYRVEQPDALGSAWSDWTNVGTGADGQTVDIVVARPNKYDATLEVRIRDGDFRTTTLAPYTINGWRGFLDPATGRIDPEVEMSNEQYMENKRRARLTAIQAWQKEFNESNRSNFSGTPGQRRAGIPILDSEGLEVLVDPQEKKIGPDLRYPNDVSIESLRPAEGGANITETRTSADTSSVSGKAAATVRSEAEAGQLADEDLSAITEIDRGAKRVTGFQGEGALARKATADFDTDVSGSSKPEANADVTGNHTSADTAAVDGRAAATVKAEAIEGQAAKTKIDTEVGDKTLENTRRARVAALQGYAQKTSEEKRSGVIGVPGSESIGMPVLDADGIGVLLDPVAKRLIGENLSVEKVGDPNTTFGLGEKVEAVDKAIRDLNKLQAGVQFKEAGGTVLNLVRGFQFGFAQHGDSVDFPKAYETKPPFVHVFPVGKCKTYIGSEADDQYIECSADDVSATGFTVSALIIAPQGATTNPESALFGGTDDLDEQGETGTVISPANLPAYDDYYEGTVQGSIGYNLDPKYSTGGSIEFVMALEVEKDASGSTWVEIGTVTFSVEVTSTGPNNETFLNRTAAGVVSGVTSSGRFRWKVKSVTNTSNADIVLGNTGFDGKGLSWTSQSGTADNTYPMTPNAGDAVLWVALTGVE